MSDDMQLYEADILDWSERQVALLRRLAAGERVTRGEIDWPNIIEELEAVGREQFHAVESLLMQALLLMLKSQGWPASSAVPWWQTDARRLRCDAASRFTPLMRQRLDLALIYRRALSALPDTIDGQPPLSVPATCSVTLDDLLPSSRVDGRGRALDPLQEIKTKLSDEQWD